MGKCDFENYFYADKNKGRIVLSTGEQGLKEINKEKKVDMKCLLIFFKLNYNKGLFFNYIYLINLIKKKVENIKKRLLWS